MTIYSESDILEFVSGSASAHLQEGLSSQLTIDIDLRERVELTRFLAESIGAIPTIQPPIRRRHVPRLFANRLVASIAVILFAVTTAAAAWYFLVDKPLLSDDFKDGWFDSELWLPPPDTIKGGGLREERGHLRLINRGYLVPRKEFDGPVELSFEWKWTQIGLDPLYADNLTVAMRTSGMDGGAPYHEVRDGVLINFNAWGGDIRHVTPGGKSIASTRLRENPAKLPMPAETWFRIRITDDGKTISVFMAGPEIDQAHWEKPVMRIVSNGPAVGKRFAIYNRELMSDPHESYVRNLQLKRLK